MSDACFAQISLMRTCTIYTGIENQNFYKVYSNTHITFSVRDGNLSNFNNSSFYNYTRNLPKKMHYWSL